MVGRDDLSSGIDDSDLEKMLLNVVKAIDPQHHVKGKVRELLQILSIDASMEIRVQRAALLDLGYNKINLPSEVELGKQLLRNARTISTKPVYDAVLDKVVESAYATIAHESRQPAGDRTVPNLAYAFELIQFAREEGLPVELNTVWYVPEDRKKDAYVVKSEQSPRKGALRLNVFLRDKIIKGIQDVDGIYHYMEHGDSEIIYMLKKGRQIGVPIQAEDIADIGYAKLLQGSSADHALRLIKIAEALGAPVNRVLSLAATEYRKLMAPPEDKIIIQTSP